MATISSKPRQLVTRDRIDVVTPTRALPASPTVSPIAPGTAFNSPGVWGGARTLGPLGPVAASPITPGSRASYDPRATPDIPLRAPFEAPGFGMPVAAAAAAAPTVPAVMAPTAAQAAQLRAGDMFRQHAPEIAAGIEAIGTRIRTGLQQMSATTTPTGQHPLYHSGSEVRSALAGFLGGTRNRRRGG